MAKVLDLALWILLCYGSNNVESIVDSRHLESATQIALQNTVKSDQYPRFWHW